MAIDTPAKRASVLSYNMGLMRVPPDGAIGEGDRASVTWFYQGLDYDSPIQGQPGAKIMPPRPGDPRVIAFFVKQGITPTRGINYEFRWALGKELGFTEQECLSFSIGDMWLEYKTTKGITDESGPFTFPLN